VRPLAYMPPLMFAVVAVALAVGLTLKPREIPSALIGAPAPAFSLAAVDGKELGLSNADLLGHVSIVNVFASWCVPCRAEHPLWMEVAERGEVPIHGLNYKDSREDATEWLEIFGNPYTHMAPI
jgi:cytochrome c biogenesis protein CcmG/thiol:disulfide interchange protein DsbE